MPLWVCAAVRSAGEKPDAAILRSAGILRCGEIFKEALYGPRSPDKKTQREFRELVEGITG
jgi:hypothetical protein